MKKTISVLLVLVMVLALCACGEQSQPAAEQSQPVQEATYVMPTPAAVAVDPKSVEGQIELIFNNLASIKLSTDAAGDRYAITDLDHNGRLELFGATTQEGGYNTTGRIFEVNENYNGFNEVAQNLKSGASLPEVIMEAADTYIDNGTYSYVFKDITRDGDTDYTVNCAVSLKNGALNFQYLGQQKTVIINGVTAVEYVDGNGNIIGPDEFNKLNAINGTKTSTNFDWFQLGEASSSARLMSSYNIFNGSIQPAVVAPAATPTPAPTNNIVIVTPGFLMITKNPTWETRTEGDTCIFVAKADNWGSCKWTFICNGAAYDANQFTNMTGCSTSGGGDGTLYVYNSNLNLNGWTVYCTFYGLDNKQTAQTNTVGFTINQKTVYNQTSGSYVQYGSDSYATAVYIPLTGETVYVSPSLCNISGYLYDGCPCTIYYTGNRPTGNSGGSIYKIDIYGGPGPVPTYEPPVYNQTSGSYVAGGSDSYATAIYIPMIGETVYVNPSMCNYYGAQYDGCPCTVYYEGYTPTGNSGGSIYSVDIYGT